MYKMHPNIWCYFLVPRFIKNKVNSYSCIKCTPSFDVQFWGKKGASYTREGTVRLSQSQHGDSANSWFLWPGAQDRVH